MSKLLVAVPSRGRPGNIARLAGAMLGTCTGDTTLLLGLDADDPQLPAYQALDLRPMMVPYEVKPDLHQVVAWVNELTVPRTRAYDFIGHIGDDNVPHTPGWDTEIMRALGKTPFAFANDLYPRAPGSLCCHVFMRSEVVDTLGYFGPPSIRHMYVDVAWMAWGIACGITYLHEVIIEHVHYTTGRVPMDESNARSLACTGPDLDAWHDYSKNGGLNADIAKLGGKPFDPGTLAEFNRNLNIPERWG